jgi:ubiquinone/menaquinone biosynthesis C-methylase UbiE
MTGDEMDRIPEPELMLDRDQACAYASADFEEPHSRFIALLQQKLPDLPKEGRALDLGCGSGDIALRFARAFPAWNVDAVDGSPAMLDLARRAAAESSLDSRVQFSERVLPRDPLPAKDCDLIFSNSLLHHLADPMTLWSSLRAGAHSASAVFVMDLLRPANRAGARELVERYAGNEPDVLRTDFYNSLLAAYRPPEVLEQLERSGFVDLELEVISDRHWIVWRCVRPAP